MKRAIGTAVALASLCTALVSCAGGGAGTQSGSGPIVVTPTDQTPLVLAFDGIDGHRVDVSEFRGRAVLIVAFLFDDLPSQGLLRHVEHVARDFGNDLVVLAVSGDRHPASIHRDMAQVFARVNELQRTRVVLADDTIREGASPLGSIDAVPTTFLVNRAGVIARRVVGYMDYPALRALVAPAAPGH